MKTGGFMNLTVPFLFWISLMGGDASGKLELALSKSKPEVYERVEIQVTGMPVAVNPFDPDAATLDLEVISPSGKKLEIPGFFARDYDRKLEGQREVLEEKSEGWRIRWMGLEPGRHTLKVMATRDGKRLASGEAEVEVAAGRRPGLARVEPTGKRYFRMDDGTPLFLNGLCVCWHGSRGTYDYDDWLEGCQKAGINYIRIWMWRHAFGIEWDRGDKVRYRMDNAWRLDRVLAEAERRGIFVMLCFDYHGIFEVKPDYWGGNNFWPRHPYNATNGGPCKVQNDFFTNADARKLYEKRLRYLVARWSAFPNILAWEFFNEIDNEYAYVKHEDVVAWHRDMGRHLRAIDPYRHLISSSFTGGSERPDLFALPEMDFSQYHSYNEQHPARMTAQKTARFFEKYTKPFFVSEYGTDWRGWKPDTDPYFRALHQAIWSGAFTGAAGTGMTWWWENIHSANLYHHWSALSAFLNGTGIGRGDMGPARFEKTEGSVLPFGVTARDEALVWLLDQACDWPEGAKVATPPEVSGVKVTLAGLEEGPWTVEWWDTLKGQRLAVSEAAAADGLLTLAPPAFRADIAGRFKKK
ncbi:MAG TPA: cellulase family glycosylhydrolase [Candidatus Paceibacterota bacterium]|nr:cellulase family glycosylhydrolase [Candidatus Paceibacterota bacterium]HRZ99275.1 cellulase family glycosylhydrolase [Candidatus Paceibacterota bacterium]